MPPVRPLRSGTNEDPSQLMPSLYSAAPPSFRSPAPSKPAMRSGSKEDASQLFPGALPPSMLSRPVPGPQFDPSLTVSYASAKIPSPSPSAFAYGGGAGMRPSGLGGSSGMMPRIGVGVPSGGAGVPLSVQSQQLPSGLLRSSTSSERTLHNAAAPNTAGLYSPPNAPSASFALRGAAPLAAVSAPSTAFSSPSSSIQYGASPSSSSGIGRPGIGFGSQTSRQSPQAPPLGQAAPFGQAPSAALHESYIPSPSKEMAVPDSITPFDSISNYSRRSTPQGPSASSPRDAVSPAVSGAMSRLSVQSAGSTGSEAGKPGSESGGPGPGGGGAGGGGGGPGSNVSDEGSLECRRFALEQLMAATDDFSPSNLIGQSPFGSVFKGKLMGCKVAIKRLEGGGWQGPIEYRTEVEVLSRMRHPNIVLLMGHCPEEHCLVYELLQGGSLQQILDARGAFGVGQGGQGGSKGARSSRPLRWHDRVRIMGEIADGLLFLHHHEPPIVHRDLNPDNVLLDANLSCKLADVGLARLIDEDDTVTASAKGTPGYIDPEEILTCEVSVLSDVYAFGLVSLQLLTGEGTISKLQKLLSAGGGRGSTGRAMSKAADVIVQNLDQSAGEWPRDLARQLAVIMLRCADPQRVRRPDLAEEVQPILQKAAERAAREAQQQRDGLESQLICPLSKVRMKDPVVAADGFTYERSAIEMWLKSSNLSPTTEQPLEHTFLMPNNGLRLLLSTS